MLSRRIDRAGGSARAVAPRPRGPVARHGSTRINELRTPRLRLRQWRDADLEPFAALNADPHVMRYFPAPLERAESDALAAHYRIGIAQRGYGVWALEVVGGAPFVGFVGLSRPRVSAARTVAMEISWRLARAHWRHGYASEAAEAAAAFGFDVARLDEIVSLAPSINAPSRLVMERLGMTHDPDDDFDHPLRGPEDPLRSYVLYRLRRPAQPSVTHVVHATELSSGIDSEAARYAASGS